MQVANESEEQAKLVLQAKDAKTCSKKCHEQLPTRYVKGKCNRRRRAKRKCGRKPDDRWGCRRASYFFGRTSSPAGFPQQQGTGTSPTREGSSAWRGLAAGRWCHSPSPSLLFNSAWGGPGSRLPTAQNATWPIRSGYRMLCSFRALHRSDLPPRHAGSSCQQTKSGTNLTVRVNPVKGQLCQVLPS